MRRSTLLLLALAAVAAPRAAAADPQVSDDDCLVARAVDAFTAGLARAGASIIGGPRQVASDLIALRVDVRDLVKSFETWVVAWGGQVAPAAPDLTALTASPLPGVESSGFGWRDDPVRRRDRKFHKGTDFRAERGTPVHAAGDGIVVFTGRKGGYGRVIFIDHGGGVVTRYAHLSAIDVATGDHVEAAMLIGKVGSTGRTTGPHLHFEIRLDGRAVDPVLAMQVAEVERSAPELAAVLATSLAPEIQDQSLDEQDPTNRARVASGRRSQAFW